MVYYNNILAVEARVLIDNSIMGYENYKKLSKRNQLHILRRGCNSTPALVEYDSIPERFKVKIKEVLGCNPYDAVRQNRIADLIEHSPEASRFFDSFTTADGKHLPADKRREYYANAIVLNAVRAFELQHKAQRASIGGRKARVIDFAIEAIAELDHSRYPFNLPDNARAFERKYKEYLRSGYDSLIHNAYKNGKKNAAVVTKEGEQVLTTMFAHHNNLNNEQVAMLYGEFARVQGWKPLSASAVAVWRDKLNSVTYAGRRGVRAYRNDMAMQVRRSMPNYPLALWTLDGWDVELFYKTTKNGRTTYGHRVTMVVVLDGYFWYPVGYAIGEEGEAENANLIGRALQNALHHTQDLFGRMYQANQIQSDHFAIKKMMPFYTVAANKVTPAEVGNAKSKPVERYFKHLNERYCQLQNNWSGYGVTSNKKLQPNAEMLARLRNSEPDYDGVVAQITAIMERERADKHDLYVGGFAQIPEERRLPMDMTQYLMRFGETTGNRNLMRGNGLSIAIAGEKHVYDSFDLNFRRYESTRWQIRYDVKDLSHVVATNEDETLQFLLEEKYVQPMALCERTEQDSVELARIREFNRANEEHITNVLSRANDTTMAIMEARKELADKQKFVIPDSHGQHKNERNRLRKMVEGETVDEIINTDSIYDNY